MSDPVTVAAPAAAPVEEQGFKVFAGNLAYSLTEASLRELFAPVAADIVSVQIINRGSRSAGYGFVALKTLEAAQKAVESINGKEVDGRAVQVELAKQPEQKTKEKPKKRNNRRGSKAVPGEVTEAEATGEPAPATTDDAAKPKKKKKARKPKKKTEEGAVETPATTEATPAEASKKERKKTPRPPRPAGVDPDGEPSKTMLFVANLGFTIDDAQLSTLFTEAGISVVSARIVRRRWGQPRKSKGYGFVDVGGEEQQKKAIAALDNKDLDGRPIAVRVAVNTPPEEGKEVATGSAPNPADLSANPAAAAAATAPAATVTPAAAAATTPAAPAAAAAPAPAATPAAAPAAATIAV